MKMPASYRDFICLYDLVENGRANRESKGFKYNFVEFFFNSLLQLGLRLTASVIFHLRNPLKARTVFLSASGQPVISFQLIAEGRAS